MFSSTLCSSSNATTLELPTTPLMTNKRASNSTSAPAAPKKSRKKTSDEVVVPTPSLTDGSEGSSPIKVEHDDSMTGIVTGNGMCTCAPALYGWGPQPMCPFCLATKTTMTLTQAMCRCRYCHPSGHHKIVAARILSKRDLCRLAYKYLPKKTANLYFGQLTHLVYRGRFCFNADHVVLAFDDTERTILKEITQQFPHLHLVLEVDLKFLTGCVIGQDGIEDIDSELTKCENLFSTFCVNVGTDMATETDGAEAVRLLSSLKRTIPKSLWLRGTEFASELKGAVVHDHIVLTKASASSSLVPGNENHLVSVTLRASFQGIMWTYPELYEFPAAKSVMDPMLKKQFQVAKEFKRGYVINNIFEDIVQGSSVHSFVSKLKVFAAKK